jgi:hypothetical protein
VRYAPQRGRRCVFRACVVGERRVSVWPAGPASGAASSAGRSRTSQGLERNESIIRIIKMNRSDDSMTISVLPRAEHAGPRGPQTPKAKQRSRANTVHVRGTVHESRHTRGPPRPVPPAPGTTPLDRRSKPKQFRSLPVQTQGGMWKDDATKDKNRPDCRLRRSGRRSLGQRRTTFPTLPRPR